MVEVAASSVSYDLHEKREAYRRNGVREYIVWRVQDRAIDWFVLRGGAYEPLAPGATLGEALVILKRHAEPLGISDEVLEIAIEMPEE